MPDIINAAFEFMAAIMLARNCWFTYKAKKTEGISILSSIFFCSWGFWNIYFYPHLGQSLSFIAGIMVTVVNTVWVGQMIYYRRTYESKLPFFENVEQVSCSE